MRTLTGKVIDLPTQSAWVVVAQMRRMRSVLNVGSASFNRQEAINSAEFWENNDYDTYLIEIEIPFEDKP